jgi:hypothetical protein
MKYNSHNKTMAVFHKIVKLVKNGVLMIIHIYAKVSNNEFLLYLKLPFVMELVGENYLVIVKVSFTR